MKIHVCAIVGFLALMAGAPAYADSSRVENALKSRPELSSFYKALVDTGVSHELSAQVSYTVFAPTNEAFARIRKDEYPCFTMPECAAQVAAIIRNHIVRGKAYIDDAATLKGGIYSIGGRFVNVGELSKNHYAVDGNAILAMSSFNGGVLYAIDGIIADPRELAALHYDPSAAALEERSDTIVTRKTIPDPACGSAGCPDEVTETTFITRTVFEPTVGQ